MFVVALQVALTNINSRLFSLIYITGGTIVVGKNKAGKNSLKEEDVPIEYLLAHYGTKVSSDEISLPLVVAKPAEACGPIENDVKGKAVLVRRGSCAFVKKAEEVQAAGGRAMIVGSLQSFILRMVSGGGVE